MSDVKEPILQAAVIELKGRDRDVEMFKDYFKGLRMTQIAVKYGISRQRVDKIKRRDKWNKMAEEIRDRAYAALSYEWKDFAGKVTSTLKKDWERILRRLSENPDAELSDKERAHGRHLLEHLTKATKMADDKPTEVTSTDGVVTHRVLLPAGVKRWGIIPPGAKVEQVEHQEEKKGAAKVSVSDVDVTDVD